MWYRRRPTPVPRQFPRTFYIQGDGGLYEVSALATLGISIRWVQERGQGDLKSWIFLFSEHPDLAPVFDGKGWQIDMLKELIEELSTTGIVTEIKPYRFNQQVCPVCKKAFTPTPGVRQKYDTQACKQKAYRQRKALRRTVRT